MDVEDAAWEAWGALVELKRAESNIYEVSEWINSRESALISDSRTGEAN